MSWRIEKTRRALGAAAIVGAMGCSGHDDPIARVTLDAGVVDVAEMCVPTDAREAPDMGLDLYFLLEHSSRTSEEWSWLAYAIGDLFRLTAPPGSNAPEFIGMGAGFAAYPMPKPAPQSCVDGCNGQPNVCGCLNRVCDCPRPSTDPQNGLCFCPRWPPSCDDADYGPGFEITRPTEKPSESPDLWSTLVSTALDPINFQDDAYLYPAVIASLRHRTNWENQNSGRRITQVLIAKSNDLLDCKDNTDGVAEVAGVLSASEAPKTYVVALNIYENSPPGGGHDPVDDFNALAAAGRTGQAIQMTLSVRQGRPPDQQKLQNDLSEVIRKIRAIDGRCEYLVPTNRTDFDSTKVNLTASSGGLLYKKVQNHAACATEPLGWYYDTDDHPGTGQPKRILACEGACRSLHGQDAAPSAGTARIKLGCPTVSARAAAGP